MSDFDERLSLALADGADDAPAASGLAQGARRRARQRRRRVAVTGGVAAALVIAVPAAVIGTGGGGDGDPPVADDPTITSTEWQTVGRDGAAVDLPPGWREVECDIAGVGSIPVYGPGESAEVCAYDGAAAAIFGSATFDAAGPPGTVERDDLGNWGGYVSTGEWIIWAQTPEPGLTRRILASARSEGQPRVDGSEWRTDEGVGLRVEVPLHWGLGADAELADFAVCAAPGDRDDPPEAWSDPSAGETHLALGYRSGRWVTVSAPTPAVADLVLATVESAPGSAAVGCIRDDPEGGADEPARVEAGSGFEEIALDGISAVVPDDWGEVACGARGWTEIGPDTADVCKEGPGLAVFEGPSFPGYEPGVVERTDRPASPWGGYVLAGGRAVWVSTADRALTQQILDSVRAP